MTTYTHTTLGDFKSLIADRLTDASRVHWTPDELGRITIAALRTWNALTSAHRETTTFDTTPGQAWYDLAALSPSRTQTVVDRDLILLAQYMLMEPPSADAWNGSSMFSGLPEFTTALQQTRDRFLSDSGVSPIRRVLPALSPSLDGVVALPDTIISPRRASWRDAQSARYYPLFPTDEDIIRSIDPQWRQRTGSPSSFSISTSPALSLRIYPCPATPGDLDLISIESGAALNPSGSGIPLGIPDDLTPAVLFGALSILLRKDGPARAEVRAAICESLYELHLSAARDIPVILTLAVNNVSLVPTSVSMLDATLPRWENSSGIPSSVGVMGGDLLALAPVPDAIYSITAEVVRNAVVPPSPTADGEYLQLSRDDIPALLAWCEFLLTFKSQGSSLSNAQRGLSVYFDRVAAYNARRVLSSTHLAVLYGQASAERTRRPFYEGESSGSGGGAGGNDAPDPIDVASRHQSRSRSRTTRRPTRLGGR